MALRDELIEEQCFTVEPGSATLTIETEAEQMMLPWLSFQNALWTDEKIQIHFSGWRVDILGKSLEELWEALQQQSVQVLRKLPAKNGDSCLIHSLSVTKVEE